MKIVYMGTPDFAVPPLAALVKNGYEVTAVVTQPDKPKGRGKTLLPTPVKEEALKHGIPVYQPKKVRDPEFMEVLKGNGPCNKKRLQTKVKAQKENAWVKEAALAFANSNITVK